MKKIILNVVFLFLMGSSIFAVEEVPKITVTGQGIVEVAPDTAMLSFAVENTGPELAPIKSQNDRITRRAVEALINFGISREDLFTSSYNISHNYEYPVKNKKREKIYRVRNHIRVTVRDVEKVGEVITILEKSGVNNIQGISYTTSKAEELKLEALERAYKDAKVKAKHLAKIEGYRIEPLAISANSYTPRPELYMAADAIRAKNSTPVYAPTEISVNANINAVFKMIK